jgi:hypothetical protein
MGDVVKIEGSAAKAKRDHNQAAVLRVKGVPLKSGTPETDADPRNPNVK